MSLTAYGEAGAFLEQHPVREPNPQRIGNSNGPKKTVEVPSPIRQGAAFSAPRKLSAPLPVFPPGQRGKDGRVTVKVKIGIDCAVREPVIISAEGELTIVYATLEAIRRWKYQPGTIGGRPVETLYTVTMNFNS